MSLALNNRLDIVILSTESKPTENLKNGSTLYEVDTTKLYVWYNGSWYDKDGNAVVEETENTETNRLVKSAEAEEVMVDDIKK